MCTYICQNKHHVSKATTGVGVYNRIQEGLNTSSTGTQVAPTATIHTG